MIEPFTDYLSQLFDLPSWGPLRSNESMGCSKDHSTNIYQVSTCVRH